MVFMGRVAVGDTKTFLWALMLQCSAGRLKTLKNSTDYKLPTHTFRVSKARHSFLLKPCVFTFPMTEIRRQYYVHYLTIFVKAVTNTTPLKDSDFFFLLRYQNCEKRNYYLRHVCSSFRPHGIRLSLDGFSLNLILEYFSKIWREHSSFITIGQE